MAQEGLGLSDGQLQAAHGISGCLGAIGGHGETHLGHVIHQPRRYYDPVSGRWTQLDPSGQDAGYAYASNDPVDLVDPDGLFPGFLVDLYYSAHQFLTDASHANHEVYEELKTFGKESVKYSYRTLKYDEAFWRREADEYLRALARAVERSKAYRDIPPPPEEPPPPAI